MFFLALTADVRSSLEWNVRCMSALHADSISISHLGGICEVDDAAPCTARPQEWPEPRHTRGTDGQTQNGMDITRT